MVIVQARSKRKHSGGRYRTRILKKMHELGRLPTHTKVGETLHENIRTRGGNIKTRVIITNSANVVNPKDKSIKKVAIKTVLENPANRHFVRRNIITKGTVIETEAGRARVTSRPGQDGSVDAVLL